ncbi:RNA 3'-terminal phosphate cyclase, partial [Thraustotheca clavata]
EENQGIAVAVGECGLDFNRDFSPRDVQIKVFRDQVLLASELNLPLFCHERDAHDEFLNVLLPFLETGRLSPSQVVVHCFTGSERELKKYIGLGFYIGLTGFISMPQRGKDLRPLISLIPSELLMVETDGPFMHPSQKRVRCEPKDIYAVIETIATAVGTTPEVVAKKTTENAIRFFKLSNKRNPSVIPKLIPLQGTAIDGSKFEGGGQILRLSGPLAVLFNKQTTVHSIRANRPKPGLARQHLGGLELLRDISGSTIEGLSLQSESVEVIPAQAHIRRSHFKKSLHGAGSVSLVLQGVLPLLVLSPLDEPTQVTLEGGTHVPYSPPLDFMSSGLALVLQRMGIHYNINTDKCGFMPHGGGSVKVTIPPAKTILPLQITQVSRKVVRILSHTIVYGGGASASISNYVYQVLVGALRSRGINLPFQSTSKLQPFKGKGKIALHVTLEMEFGNVFTGSCIAASSPESAVQEVLEELDRLWTTDACMDEHIADNVLVYMALSSGNSSIRVPKSASSLHIEAAIDTITQLTGVQFTSAVDGNSRLISCVGCAYRETYQ